MANKPPPKAGEAKDTDLIPGREDPWRRKWQSTSVFFLGDSHGQRRLVGYSPWGDKESDRTERLSTCTHTWSSIN